jgi:myo-inositol-1(or 4)-monophosphatase
MLTSTLPFGQRVKTLTTMGLKVLMPNSAKPKTNSRKGQAAMHDETKHPPNGIDEKFLDRCLEVAFKACDGAREILDNHFGNLRNVEEKFQAGLVSDADRESEIYIKECIHKVFPNHAILGEESGLTGLAPAGDGALWMIDPLDGTTNFIHQFPFFCISIGLEFNGELVLGVVDAPMLASRFHAVKGRGAYKNDQLIHASSRESFCDGLFATGFSSYDTELDAALAIAAQTIREGRGLRRAGAAALDLCFVAQGSFDVFWEQNLSPWDMAAGVVIAREAGAIATDIAGAPFYSRGTTVICGNRFLHPDVLKLIKTYQKSPRQSPTPGKPSKP